MANVLKKLHINPLKNFGLTEEVKEHEAIQTDEELASFYHKLLTRFEGRPLLTSFIFGMISYSVGFSLRSLKTEL